MAAQRLNLDIYQAKKFLEDNNKIQEAAKKKRKASTEGINVGGDKEQPRMLTLSNILFTQVPAFAANDDSIID